MIKGYSEFDPSVRLAGVVFNRIGGSNHKRMIEESLLARALGWIPKRPELEVASRHLGLRMASEVAHDVNPGEIIGKYVDVDAVIEAARSAGSLAEMPISTGAKMPEVTISVARDAAFCFYYEDNLDSLASAGARLEYFSPMHDSLPTQTRSISAEAIQSYTRRNWKNRIAGDR